MATETEELLYTIHKENTYVYTDRYLCAILHDYPKPMRTFGLCIWTYINQIFPCGLQLVRSRSQPTRSPGVSPNFYNINSGERIPISWSQREAEYSRSWAQWFSGLFRLFTMTWVNEVLRNLQSIFPDDISRLFRQVLTTTYFQWNRDFYKQVGDVAIVSPLS